MGGGVHLPSDDPLATNNSSYIIKKYKTFESWLVKFGHRGHSVLQPAVYQVTRQGHEHCDVSDGMLLDITPLDEGGSKLFTLYDKDLTEGVNLLIGT